MTAILRDTVRTSLVVLMLGGSHCAVDSRSPGISEPSSSPLGGGAAPAKAEGQQTGATQTDAGEPDVVSSTAARTSNASNTDAPTAVSPPLMRSEATADAGVTPAPPTPGEPSAAPGAAPPATSSAIIPVGGEVLGTSNSAGIQGAFYTVSDANDGGTSSIQPSDFSQSVGSALCVSGVARVVTDPMTGVVAGEKSWGAGIGFNLADTGAASGLGTWSRGNVTGFSFDVTGNVIPESQLRFRVLFPEGGQLNGDYCKTITAGHNTVLFSDVVNDCGPNGAMSPPLPQTTAIQAVWWQVTTALGSGTAFDFCVDQLAAISG